MAGTGRRAQADGGNTRGRLRGEQTGGGGHYLTREGNHPVGCVQALPESRRSRLVDWVGPRACVNVCVVCVLREMVGGVDRVGP